MKGLLVSLLVLSGCATLEHPDPWRTQDTLMQGAVTATLMIDALQTLDIQYRDDLREVGFARHFVGSQPSTNDIWMYFATVSFTSYLISYYLPEEWRPYWQGANIAVQIPVILNNCGLGMGRICRDSRWEGR